MGRSRAARVVFGVRVGLAYVADGVRWVVQEVLGDLLVAVVACLAVAGVVLATVWGWQHEPAVTAAVFVGVLAYLGFGARALLGRRAGGTRAAAVAAAVLAVVVAVLLEAASSCRCLP